MKQPLQMSNICARYSIFCVSWYFKYETMCCFHTPLNSEGQIYTRVLALLSNDRHQQKTCWPHRGFLKHIQRSICLNRLGDAFGACGCGLQGGWDWPEAWTHKRSAIPRSMPSPALLVHCCVTLLNVFCGVVVSMHARPTLIESKEDPFKVV